MKLNEATMNDLDKHLAELINERLAKPIYLRVTQGDDGRLSVEQVAFLRVQDLSALIHIDERTIRGWVKKDLIPSFKAPGSSVYLFDLNEVIRAIRSDAIETGQEEHASLRIAAPKSLAAMRERKHSWEE